ncbi:hypothetical protein WR25_18393 [Diploscapter pachys]|uniref:Uncharacterized protein n=1 Tax=Diploscapter pachys TaxID=2018661 RepID=A0A2A2JZD1_9BILA|nr:hypothetical protein WR25_18393 [Diploscapter pachys]
MSDKSMSTSTNPISKPIPATTTDSSPSNPHIKTITREASENSNICDAVAIDIGTSKCKIAVCKERYIQIVEHEANRSVPSYVAYSEQREWLVGRMAENYAVCLQNVIYVELIDEPLAVTAAYAPRLNIHLKGDVALVFCMGAGYLQVAAYFIQQKAQEEKANWTDLTIAPISEIEPIVENFAGDEIDRLIVEEMMKNLEKQNEGTRPKLSPRAERRLKIACEKMKCALAFAPHTRIDVDSLYRNGDEDCDLVEVIQKDEIKEYYNKEVDQIIKKIGEVYKEIKPKFILLAGGSTRIPLISESLSEAFKDSTVCNFLNVDEVAAVGATAIVSKTVTAAEKSIDYKRVIEIIKEQEKALMSHPAANKNYVGDSPSSEAEMSSKSSSQPQQIAAIGIDLGTTFSCVSVMENGRPFTIPNDHGNNTTPSVVAFDEDNVLIGIAATDAAVPPTNLVYDSKRLIGWQFIDQTVQADIRTWPFRIADINGKPHYEIAKGKTSQNIEPEFVSAEVLKYMKNTAERYLRLHNKVLRGAVITVPAYFVDRQRQATMEAAKKVGINVLRLVTEPVAAAVAYSFQHTQTTKSTVLVYDLGGGTFDVTIAEIEGPRLTIKAISGNLHLGGQDFDKNLLDYVIETFKTETGVDLTDDTKKKALKRVRAAVVKAKESLSFRENASVHVEAVDGNQDLQIELTREDMNRLNGDLFKGTMQIVDDVINEVEPAITADNIDQVILVGGSTRIPMVQELLIQRFGKDKLLMNVNQDEAVAQGAAILANGLIDKKNSAMSVTDVLPFTIGMAYRETLMKEVFKRGTRYPCETVIHSETEIDNQTNVSQGIYQGERVDCRLNIKLGQVTLNGLKRVPKGNKLETKFVIDENGILNVTLTELATKKSSTVEISYDSEAVRNVDVRNHTTTNVIHTREDEEFRQRVLERNEVEDEVYQIQKTLESLKDRTEINSQTHEDLMKKIRPFLDWTDSLPESKDLRPRLKTLKQELAQIITKNTPAGNMQ